MGSNDDGVKATINGHIHELPDGTTVAQLLERLGAPRAGIAVARNANVVRRADFETQQLAEGDQIEIIKAVAGG